MAQADPSAAPFAAEVAKDAPEVDPAWDWIWSAWWRLGSGDRPYTVMGMTMPMGGTIIRSEPGFIPWTAIQHWVEVRNISPEDAELLDQCFQAMDVEFKKWWTENNKVT